MLLVVTLCVDLWPMISHPETAADGKAPVGDPSPLGGVEGMTPLFSGTVTEVIDAGRHIYLHIDTGEDRVWVAVPAFDGNPGDEVLVPPGIPIADFQSKTLHRRFKMIYFVGSVRRISKRPPD